MAVLITVGLCAAAGGDDRPRLLLNPGGHSAAVHGVAFSPDGRELISASSDHRICFWDVSTGELKRTVYLPIFTEQGAGKLAISKDGRWLAASSRNARREPVVLQMSLPDCRIVREFSGHADAIWFLTLSPTGKYLATASRDHTARVWEFSTGRSVQVLRGHRAQVTSLCFSPDERQIATASYDGTGRIWQLDSGKEVAVLEDREQPGTSVSGVAWSPDGKSIATGSLGQPLRIWTPAGALRERLPNLVTSRSLQFTRDSRAILSAGLKGGYLYDLDRHGLRSACTVLQSEFAWTSVLSPDERFVATGGQSGEELYLWSATTGEVLRQFAGRGTSPKGAAWSPDGGSIAWGTRLAAEFSYHPGVVNQRHPLERSFQLAELILHPDAPGSWSQGLTRLGELTAEIAMQPDGRTRGWVTVKEGDRSLCTIEHDLSRVTAFVPGDRLVVAGSDVKLYDARSGRLLHRYAALSSAVHAVCASPDGRFLLATANDMTLHLWPLQPTGAGRTPRGVMGAQSISFLEAVGLREALDSPLGFRTIVERLDQSNTESHRRFADRCRVEFQADIAAADGEIPLLLNLFVAADDWIAWTPQGYYAASPGGERLMGWHVNNGPDQLASFYPAAHFRKQFYRPDVIQRLLKTGSLERALQEAGAKEEVVTDVARNLPPQVEIVSPAESQLTTDQNELQVTVAARQIGPHPVTSLQMLVNGRPLGGTGGIIRFEGTSVGPRHTFTVPLLSGMKSVLQARADSAVSYALSQPLDVTLRAPAADDVLPSLYVLAIGVSDYDDEALRLQFAHSDARRLAEAFVQNSTTLYRKVDTKVIVDKQATQRGILAGLGWLKREMTQHDVGVVFYSGHGDRDEETNLYFLPCDIEREQPLLVSGVSEAQVKSILQGLPGRLLVILDCCHAGTFGGDRRKGGTALTDDLVRDLATDDYGVVTMASSLGRQVSLENAGNQSGIFTLALVEALQGQADYNRDSVVHFNELNMYVSDRVKELSKGRQTPITSIPGTVRSFPLSRTPESRSVSP